MSQLGHGVKHLILYTLPLTVSAITARRKAPRIGVAVLARRCDGPTEAVTVDERAAQMRFDDSALWFQLHALANNLANFLRTTAPPELIEHCSMTSLRERLIKTGTRLVHHGRYAIFQMAGAALLREVFAGTLDLINALRAPPESSVAA